VVTVDGEELGQLPAAFSPSRETVYWTVPDPGAVTALQLSATVPPTAGVAAVIVGAKSFVTLADASPVPVAEK
jgi:hypothetical protein